MVIYGVVGICLTEALCAAALMLERKISAGTQLVNVLDVAQLCLLVLWFFSQINSCMRGCGIRQR